MNDLALEVFEEINKNCERLFLGISRMFYFFLKASSHVSHLKRFKFRKYFVSSPRALGFYDLCLSQDESINNAFIKIFYGIQALD